MRKNIAVLITVFVLSSSYINAQNTGYGGKRFLIKTDAIHGIQSAFTGLTLEFIATRNLTLSVGYKSYSSSVSQKYTNGEYESFKSFDHISRGTIPDRAKIKTRDINAELRYYFGYIIPAPRGMFVYVSGNYGQMDVKSGNYYESLVTDIGDQRGKYITYQYKNVNFMSFEGGAGYQTFLNKWLAVGVKGGIGYTKLYPENSGIPEEALSGVAKKFGHNLFSTGTVVPNSAGGTSYGKDRPTHSSIGLSLYVQVGILLF